MNCDTVSCFFYKIKCKIFKNVYSGYMDAMDINSLLKDHEVFQIIELTGFFPPVKLVNRLKKGFSVSQWTPVFLAGTYIMQPIRACASSFWFNDFISGRRLATGNCLWQVIIRPRLSLDSNWRVVAPRQEDHHERLRFNTKNNFVLQM